MTELQKDTMIANILQEVQQQIIHLVNENQFEDSLALYKEWEEHFNNDITQVHIVIINDLTTI